MTRRFCSTTQNSKNLYAYINLVDTVFSVPIKTSACLVKPT